MRHCTSQQIDIIIKVTIPIITLLIGWFGNMAWDYYKEPRLTLAPQPIIEDNDHYRLQVQNEGRNAAINCTCKINFDDIVRDDVIDDKVVDQNIVNDITSEQFMRVQGERLPWADLSKPLATINPKTTIPQKLELFRICTSGSEFYINIPRENGYWYNFPNTFCLITLRTKYANGDPRIYHGTLEISAENVRSPINEEFNLIPLLSDKKLELQLVDK